MDDNNKMTDNELICRYRNGDFVCFNILLERYQAKVYGYIFSLVKHKDMADEIFQDTFYKVIEDIIINDQYKNNRKFVHWVLRIAHNCIIEKTGKRNKKTMEDITDYKKMLKAKTELMKNCHLRYGCSLRFEYDDEVNSPNQDEFLESLTTEQVKNEPLPLRLLLKNSVYYPASGLDGGVIKYCNTTGRDMGIRSFVYCDYNTNEVELCDNVANHFRGYTIFAHRSVAAEELGVKRLSMEPIDDRAKGKHLTPEEEPFCHWFIMEREDAFDDEHGPKHFSLLFLCCEGVTAYVQLYCHNEIVPTALAIIQPGTGFGGNWTDFRDCYGALSYVIGHTPQGMPRWIFNGGIGYSDEVYSRLPWYDYEYVIGDKVANYYGPGEGQMAVFKRGKRQVKN